MFRKQALFLAAFVTAGAALLSACGGQTDGTPNAAPASAGSAVDAGASGGLDLLSGTARSNNAPTDTGDLAPASAPEQVRTKWVSLRAGKAGDLNPVVLNGKGMTIYRFDNDSAHPSKSTCNGDCEKKWPPVKVTKGTKVFLAGIKKSAIGVVKRDDGSLQLTVGGWPAYTFSGDKNPGDTNGEGVGGTWFGMSPTGGKVLPAGSPTTSSPSSAPSAPGTKAATSTILFDDAFFSDNGASQGLSFGAGDDACQNLARPDVTSSLTTDGTLKLWTGKNCTGKSVVVNDDVQDLTALGFDDAIESVHFGA
ncbi:hypothetical protein [Amycolatopsis sp. FDAARGOS 1241]|uniref:hypothetical protein n=1 Tax=Amycolatopsis sp. FDAARGOS 1241 TaxID=2778070 RepID=UPI001951B5C0|nr:hypothetical protein [Amycolatopsis sp. FDAARGOS 1241]QRP46890.1 hypothetical protein I6J71_02205 [Amycolatopsis sp. FDAARGOS 1241]